MLAHTQAHTSQVSCLGYISFLWSAPGKTNNGDLGRAPCEATHAAQGGGPRHQCPNTSNAPQAAATDVGCGMVELRFVCLDGFFLCLLRSFSRQLTGQLFLIWPPLCECVYMCVCTCVCVHVCWLCFELDVCFPWLYEPLLSRSAHLAASH